MKTGLVKPPVREITGGPLQQRKNCPPIGRLFGSAYAMLLPVLLEFDDVNIIRACVKSNLTLRHPSPGKEPGLSHSPDQENDSDHREKDANTEERRVSEPIADPATNQR